MIMNNEGRVPTTDEMDETTPEDRPKLTAMCENCGAWKPFTRPANTPNTYKGLVCDGCGGQKFREVTSQRTFDIERAKKISAKWLKAHKK
jgi:hypothetical protein